MAFDTIGKADMATGKVTKVTLPSADSNPDVWASLWTSDHLVKYDPIAGKRTTFDPPVRGTGIRHVSLLEQDGKTKVVVPVYRSSQVGVSRYGLARDAFTR